VPIIAKEPESNYNPAPEGLHQGVCADVVDLGEKLNTFKNVLQHKVRIVWQLDVFDEENRRPFEISKQYTNSLHEKATLRTQLEAWRGRRFTDEELKGFDLEKLIGANCQIQVVHVLADNGKTYANVQALVPLSKNMPKMRVSDDFVRYADRGISRGLSAPQTVAQEEVPF
jgi:hypothetical protein